MALNIKNAEVEQLASEVARLAHESKTQAIKRALLERREKLRALSDVKPSEALQKWLEEDVWPNIPADQLGRKIPQEEIDDILGYGPEGF